MMLGRSAVFALFTVVLGGFTLPASAQNYRGKFTLPYEAHWGAVNLQPGEYTVSTDIVGGTPVLFVSNHRTTASIFTGPVDLVEASDNGLIELTEVNGTHVVTRFLAGALGKDYSFRIPKSIAGKGFGTVALKKSAIPMSSAQ